MDSFFRFSSCSGYLTSGPSLCQVLRNVGSSLLRLAGFIQDYFQEFDFIKPVTHKAVMFKPNGG